MEYHERNEILLKEVPVSKSQPDEWISCSIYLEMFVDILKRFKTVLMLNIDFEPVDVLVRADTLNTEQEIIEFPIKLSLIKCHFLFLPLCVLL
jgi:hypothetical protein